MLRLGCLSRYWFGALGNLLARQRQHHAGWKEPSCSLATGCLRSLSTRFVREMQCIYGTEFSAIVWALARKAQSAVSALPGVSRQAAGCSRCTAGSETCLELGTSVEERWRVNQDKQERVPRRTKPEKLAGGSRRILSNIYFFRQIRKIFLKLWSAGLEFPFMETTACSYAFQDCLYIHAPKLAVAGGILLTMFVTMRIYGP